MRKERKCVSLFDSMYNNVCVLCVFINLCVATNNGDVGVSRSNARNSEARRQNSKNNTQREIHERMNEKKNMRDLEWSSINMYK